MKSKIVLPIILVLIILGGGYFISTNVMGSSISVFEGELGQARSNMQETPPNTDSSLTVSNNNVEQFLEIEMSADDIRRADSKGFIGLTEPFNSEYITRIDVINSINRIGEDIVTFDEISPKYQSEFLTLRHVEMVEGIREKESTLSNVLKEYATTILPIEREQEGNTLKNNTSSSNSELQYQAEVSNAETESLLNGGN